MLVKLIEYCISVNKINLLSAKNIPNEQNKYTHFFVKRLKKMIITNSFVKKYLQLSFYKKAYYF